MKASELRVGQTVGFYNRNGSRTMGIVISRAGRRYIEVMYLTCDDEPVDNVYKSPNWDGVRQVGKLPHIHLEKAYDYPVEVLD